MRKVKIRSWESMEKEFGLDEMGDIDNPQSLQMFVEAMRYMCGKIIEVDSDNRRDCFTIADWMIEPEEPEFQGKTIEDFPLVEVRYNKGPWKKKRYLHTESIGFVCIGLSGHVTSVWDELRPIKPVDISELKKAAGLV